MQPDDAVRIRHILEAAEAAQRFIDGHERDSLDGDQMLLFALVRAIEIIGKPLPARRLERAWQRRRSLGLQ